MALGLKIKSFIPYKQGQEEKDGGGLPIPKISGIGMPSAQSGAQSKIPLPVAAPFSTPPQSSLAASAPIQDVIPMPPPPEAMAATQPPSGDTTPPSDDKKKAGKDVMNLFIEEEAKMAQASNLAANLPEIDMTKLYHECLDCKQILG